MASYNYVGLCKYPIKSVPEVVLLLHDVDEHGRAAELRHEGVAVDEQRSQTLDKPGTRKCSYEDSMPWQCRYVCNFQDPILLSFRRQNLNSYIKFSQKISYQKDHFKNF
jgi:hypothetical protein